MSLLILTGAGLAIGGTVGVVAASNSKRDHASFYHGQKIRKLHNGDVLYYFDVANSMHHKYHKSLTGHNNFTYTGFTINGINAYLPGGLVASSDLGNHILMSTGNSSFVDLMEALATQHDKKCIGDCAVESGLVVGNQTQSKLAKRTSYYNVDWASYNYDDKNYVDAYDTLEYPGDSYSALSDELNAAYQSLGYPDTWKYCLCTDMANDGAYDDLGTDVGLVGEVYFNTYGGVDGYCTDNHCGAQCQTDGCQ